MQKTELNPRIFLHNFREVDNQHPTRFSQDRLYYKKSVCKTTSFAVTLHLEQLLKPT